MSCLGFSSFGQNRVKLFTFYNKETTEPEGYVADFCPIERRITVCRIDGVYSSKYLNFIRIDRGSRLRNDRICCACGISIPGEAAAYLSYAPDPCIPLSQLEITTHPGVTERNRDLIELASQIRRGVSSDPTLKEALLREQFAWLDRIAEHHWKGETKLDRTALVFGFASLVLFFGGLFVVTKFVPQNRRLDGIGIMFCVGLALLIATSVVFFLAPQRTMTRRVLPLVAMALEPLRPSDEQLVQVFVVMRAEGFKYATKFKPAKVLAAIRSGQSQGWANLKGSGLKS